MKTLIQFFFFLSFLCIFCTNNALAQITLTGTFSYVDPGETYSYSVGGASACPSNYLVSTADGTNTANNTGNGVGTGPFSYKWDNKSGGDFSMTASNGGSSCSSITPKIQNNITHIYLQQVSSISVPGGNTLGCGTTPITISVSVPTTSPSFNVNNTSQNVQLIYTWNIPNWGVNNVQTTTNQLTVTPHQINYGGISVTVKRNDAKVTTSSSTTVNRAVPTLSSVSITSLLICNSTATTSVSASGTNADKFIWTPSANVRINGSSTAQTVAGPVNIGAVGTGTYTVAAYSTACDYTSSSSPAYPVSYGGPTASFPVKTLIDAGSNMWQLSYANAGSTSATYSVIAGSATLNPINKDCYVTTTGGATIQVVATNSCGNSSPTLYTIPPKGGSMLVAYPNPAFDELGVKFGSVENSDFLPESISLVSESSSKEVAMVNVQDVYKRKTFQDNNKIIIDVKNFPRGIYYLMIVPTKASEDSPSQIRIKLE